MKKLCSKLIALFLVIICKSTSLFAQAEVPVLADAAGNPQVMFLIDDSGSMNAIVEHPDFNMSIPAVTNTANDIPSVIFRHESGSSSPTTSHNLRPVLIEINDGIFDSSSGNLFSGSAMSSAATMPLMAQIKCNTSTGALVNCPTSLGSATPNRGANTANLYGSTSISGSSIFTTANLAKNSGVNVVDSGGNEYLYIKYKRNDYFTQNYSWESVWANFNSDGENETYYTRAYATAGGTVVFNNKSVFLSSGWYRIEYLRWIFYVATAAQRAALPGKHRLKVVKDVVNSLITDNPSVRFGLSAFNSRSFTAGAHSGNLGDQWFTPDGNASSSNGPKVRSPVGTASATILSALNTMTPRGGTPLTNSYIEVLRYFKGQPDNDPNFSGTYTSPITSACDAYFIVALTDGLPSGESPNNFFGSWVSDYDGDGAETLATNQTCSNDDNCSQFLDDAAFFAANNDFNTSLPDIQVVRTYAVGLGLSFPLLNQMAEKGGTGQAYRADTAQEISDTLNNIVSLIITSPVAGAGAALAETFGETGKVYRPRFRADTWNGNIDVYSYNPVTDNLDFQFDIGDILESRDITSSPRTIIAGLDPDGDGNTNQQIEFTTSNSSSLRPYLFKFFIDGTESATTLEEPLLDYAVPATAETLIRFVQGEAITGLRARDRDGDGNVEKLGDIVYSRPVEVGPKNGNYNSFDGYNSFIASRSSQPRILLVGGNDGMMHAFDSESGEELWAYIPSSQLPYLERLSRILYNANNRRSYVDGSISIEDAYVNGQWRTLLMFGLRTGGSTYTVLDITNRSSPTLLFETSAAASTGQSWSKPVVVPFGGTAAAPSTYQWYMVVGTGEGKSTAGTNVVAFNLNSSAPAANVISLSAGDAIGTRTSSVIATQNDRDMSVDRLYVGTEQGDMYRIAVGPTVGSWSAARVYDGASTHPIVATPLAVLVDNPQYVSGGSGVASHQLAIGLYWGTGRYDERADITGVGLTSQRIIGVFDPVNTVTDTLANAAVNLTTTNLQNQSVSTYSVRRDADGIYRVPAGKSGFYIDTATTLTLASGNFINPTGMAFYEAVNLRGSLFISTFLPNQGQCAVGGQGFLQALNFRTGGGMIVDYKKDPTKPFYNGGVPDIDGNNVVNATDLTSGITQGKILPATDVHVESVVSGSVPYVFSGTLAQNDIRMHSTNGGIIPAVSSLGDQGAPVAPSILKGAQRVIIQPAYPIPPTTGNPTSGVGSPGGSSNPPSASLPPPEILPINIYNLPLDIVSFHESTSQ